MWAAVRSHSKIARVHDDDTVGVDYHIEVGGKPGGGEGGGLFDVVRRWE